MRIYMDVDGVVNAWYADRAWGLGMESDDVCGYVLAWSGKMVRRFGSLFLDGSSEVELIWLSGWGKDSVKVAEAIGWDFPSRVLGPLSGELTFPSVYWKAEALWEDLAGYGGYWAWFDSGLSEIALDIEYAELIGADRGYVPNVDGDIGITPEMLISLELKMDVESGLEGGV